MKRVAIVGADFCPSSLPPALRIRFFAQHLPEFGWQPTVITTDPGFYDCPLDPEIERLIPSSLEVIRTPTISRKWTRVVGIGDLGTRSMYAHWQVLRDLCHQGHVDLVFIPVPPYIPMVLGRFAHDRFGVPYVIDYIDPWASDCHWTLPASRRPPKWMMAYLTARVLEKFTIRRVAHVTGVSLGTIETVRNRYPWLRSEDTTEIPYGGETQDWEYIRQNPRANRVFDPKDGLLHIGSIGAYTETMRLTLSAFFAAVRKACDQNPGLKSRLRLHFVGTSYNNGRRSVVPIAQEQGVAEVVDEHPRRVPYLDALQLLSDAHALLIIGSDEPHYTPSKVFPYILARKPLLTIFHRESSVIRILEETRASSVVTFSAEEPLAGKIDELALRVRELTLLRGSEPATRWQAFEAYTTRAMTARLAAAFELALARRSVSKPAGIGG